MPLHPNKAATSCPIGYRVPSTQSFSSDRRLSRPTACHVKSTRVASFHQTKGPAWYRSLERPRRRKGSAGAGAGRDHDRPPESQRAAQPASSSLYKPSRHPAPPPAFGIPISFHSLHQKHNHSFEKSWSPLVLFQSPTNGPFLNIASTLSQQLSFLLC
jgi:hypothetical protein